MIRECLWLIWAGVSVLLMVAGVTIALFTVLAASGFLASFVDGEEHDWIASIIILAVWWGFALGLENAGMAGIRAWRNRARRRCVDGVIVISVLTR